MKQIKRRQIIVGSAALGAAAALPVRLSAQTMPELQTLRSTSK